MGNPRYFISTPTQISHLESCVGAEISLPEDSSHHLRDVLRCSIGEQIDLVDTQALRIYVTKISALLPVVTVQIESSTEFKSKRTEISLLFALCKGDKNELVCDWATELGCTDIFFWQAHRSVVRIRGEEEISKKTVRLSKIALAAAQQSKQLTVPRVTVVEQLDDALKKFADKDSLKVFCSLSHQASTLTSLLKESAQTTHITIVVGPEGDFNEVEEALLKEYGFIPASLGESVLRSELAAVTAITLSNQLCLNNCIREPIQ